MIQRFIELGEGYADYFELIELTKNNASRIHSCIQLEAGENKVSLAVALSPPTDTRFMPIYLCCEGLHKNSKRISQFEELATSLGHHVHVICVQEKSSFYDRALYNQYLLGLLRMQHILPPMR
ncbi:DUF7147 family protein [Shouchella patagoniensis]|uniref:DUF7147 family protein n=1 Tax=Shouchella patagoniensis TaxID=228576 RepID=UPI0009952F56|nr:hypothetical protein [Shouchella patagoniensis]